MQFWQLVERRRVFGSNRHGLVTGLPEVFKRGGVAERDAAAPERVFEGDFPHACR